MQPLDKSLRNILERTIKEARDTAETAARIALEQLGVGEPSAYTHLSDDERRLRRKLRAHGRQLGNGRDAKGHQALDRLIEEVAYEHWHRMLFARFLAENDLLMYPDPVDPVAVTLEECEDLAADEGAANGWELAARYASHMLPQIFRSGSPVFQLILPPEHQQKLESLVSNLSIEVFSASDSLGWVYQFWQAKKKDEVNTSGLKIGARQLPAVTQIFTEPYMVNFLLDNSIGAWWAVHRLSNEDLENASSEEELRNKATIPGLNLQYLRFAQKEDGSLTHATGTYDSLSNNIGELKILDPCCGSGHFLVAAFLMLVPMRMAIEGLNERDAVNAVLKDNLHGLEIEQRCVELAAFALALAAWRYPNSGGYRKLPRLNIACSGLALSAKKKEWFTIADDSSNLRFVLEELYNQFRNAPVLGSLINIEHSLSIGPLFNLKLNDIKNFLSTILTDENDYEIAEMGVVAQGLVDASRLLANKYDFVTTNVPYLSQSKQDIILRQYIQRFFPKSKADLATAFVERCISFLKKGGSTALVTPHNWHYLASYKKLRKKILKTACVDFIASLGDKAFSTALWDYGICLNIISNEPEKKDKTRFIRLQPQTPYLAIADCLISDRIEIVGQNALYHSDSSRMMIVDESRVLLDEYCDTYKGICTGDSEHYIHYFWEHNNSNNDIWWLIQGSYSGTCAFDGRNLTFKWQGGEGDFIDYVEERLGEGISAWIRGREAWSKSGIVVRVMGALPCVLYGGQIYNNNVSTIIPKSEKYLPAIWEFCSSDSFNTEVRKINQKSSITDNSFVKIPFDIAYWVKESQKKYPNGIPKPHTDDPTQWIFHGHPCGSVVWDEKSKWTTHNSLRIDETVLHVAIARLLGYCWPAELDTNMELADEQREWVCRCKALQSYADDDGILCIPPVRGEPSAVDRLLNLLAVAYGDAWSGNILAQLLKSVGHGGKTLETWLRNKFFIQHSKLFRYRPFVWHIWDGLNDGFAALVNYHKLNHKNLETLIYTYLGDWIKRLTQDVANGTDGAEEKLAASESLKKKLELILEGETPYDIFVRWKSIEKQPIGWNPDLNDGVRLNIRPFITVGDVKKRGAGVLRDKPNIKWSKDRGKDVASAPWYHLFKGDRINDYHLELNSKSFARRQNNI